MCKLMEKSDRSHLPVPIVRFPRTLSKFGDNNRAGGLCMECLDEALMKIFPFRELEEGRQG